MNRHDVGANGEFVVAALSLLGAGGLSPVPVCRPVNESKSCSAPWHPDPCDRCGKRPLVRGYRRFSSFAAPAEQLRDWASEFDALNLGAVIQEGFVMVEADSPDADRELIDLDPSLVNGGPCRERRPGRGRAYLLRTDLPMASRAHLGESGAIDVRGPGGLWIVPPSVHETGHQLRWVARRAPWQTKPLVLKARLRELLAQTSEPRSPKIQRHGSPEPSEFTGVGAHLSPRVQRLRRCSLRVKQLWEMRGKTRGDTSASGYDFALARALLQLGAIPGEVVGALMARRESHRQDLAYATLTARNAMGDRRR